MVPFIRADSWLFSSSYGINALAGRIDVYHVTVRPIGRAEALMVISRYYLIPPLPEGLEGLAEVGLDLRWFLEPCDGLPLGAD